MQIVQELCKRPGLNKAGFDMPTIYIPDSNKVCLIFFNFSGPFLFTEKYLCLAYEVCQSN